MATEFNIPSAPDIRSYLVMMYDNIAVEPGTPVDADAAGTLVGCYLDDDDKAVAACVCDIEFAAFASSALTMIPPGGAEDAVANKALEPGMAANFHELMNIFSRFFITENTPHLRLSVSCPVSEAPDDIKAVIANATDRADVSIDLPRYGKGNISVMAI